MTKKIVGIWAQDEQGVIGKDQVLPWSLPAELQHFKQTTIGHNLLMGRVTFDGMGQRALPKRLSLILTRDRDYKVDNERVLAALRRFATANRGGEVPILLPVAVALAVILYVSDRLSVPTVREDSAALGGSHYPECPPSPIPQPRGKTPI